LELESATYAGVPAPYPETAMALLPILEFPDPRLRTKAALIEAAEVTTPAFQELIDNMFLTMYDAPGIGLAATQVDVHKRFMVIDVSEEKNEPHVFINPEIVAKDGGRVYQEAACRSGHLRRRDPCRHHHREVPGPQRPGTADGGR
jgi:peptide deformylase